MPTDKVTYNGSDEAALGVTVIYNGAAGLYVDVVASEGGFFYSVYPCSAANPYGGGAKARLIRNGVTVSYDGSEMADPGWTHGGAGDEWVRGIPTSANSIFGQLVTSSGPMAGIHGTRAIGGDRCWGTDLGSAYNAQVDAWLQTPPLNLTGVTAPVFLKYYDWRLLETFYDTCTVEVVDAKGGFLGYVDADTSGDYDWTQRVYDLTPYAGRRSRCAGAFSRTSFCIATGGSWTRCASACRQTCACRRRPRMSTPRRRRTTAPVEFPSKSPDSRADHRAARGARTPFGVTPPLPIVELHDGALGEAIARPVSCWHALRRGRVSAWG
jgi:hypothetical protein